VTEFAELLPGRRVAERLPAVLSAIRECLPADVPLYDPPAEDHAVMMRELLDALWHLQREYDAEQGPLAHWRRRWHERLFTQLDLQAYDFDDDGGSEDRPEAVEAILDGFADSAFGRAASAYQRECGWDFAPGPAGVWILAYRPTTWIGGAETGDGHCTGNLVSFAILHDRDSDGQPESLSHLWTASSMRRKGAARQVVDMAREWYPLRLVEGPITDVGVAFVRAVVPELAP
jgi:hypothetical protein